MSIWHWVKLGLPKWPVVEVLICRKKTLDFQGLKILICVCDMSLVAAQEAVPIRKQYVLYGQIFQNAKLKVL